MHDVFLVGYGYVVCGDEKGSLWTYHITDNMIEDFKSGKTFAVTEVVYSSLDYRYIISHNVLNCMSYVHFYNWKN